MDFKRFLTQINEILTSSWKVQTGKGRIIDLERNSKSNKFYKTSITASDGSTKSLNLALCFCFEMKILSRAMLEVIIKDF